MNETDELPWKQRGLVKCDLLARSVPSNADRFEYLDSSQLLKRLLGLHKKLGQEFQLLYLWYDIDGPAGQAHATEVAEFGSAVDREIDFQAMTYQSLVSRLQQLSNASDGAYLEYLKNRYLLG